ncbi:MAG TPA: DUF5996 family protein [Terriglobales bacterium]|nr:DUF5996 family protein [Terriglobales bacterium]
MSALRVPLPSAVPELWPALPLAEWEPTRATLHMWTQMVGKVRTELTPPVNHFWHSALYVTSRGLTSSAIPYHGGSFEMEFDFTEHKLRFRSSRGERRAMRLYARSVADFYREFMSTLRALGVNVNIRTMPQEVPDPVPFERDEEHASYEPDQAHCFWQVLLACWPVLHEFRGRFIGKCSPVHFFWGSFDLAVTRFSGRRAPERPGADFLTREAYSHECASVGWWPGGGPVKDAAFYAYAAPEPDGFKTAVNSPGFYSSDLNEYLLMYEDVRNAADPRGMLLDFCQKTYEAAAGLGKWDRAALERSGI